MFFDYVYYKLYKASLKSTMNTMPHAYTVMVMGLVVALNILTINALLAKFDIAKFLFQDAVFSGGLVALMVILLGVVYNKNQRDKILVRYDNESKTKKRTGSILVFLYVAISFLSIFAIALFRPGKL